MFILFALILPYSPLVLLLCRWQKRRSKTVSSGPLILHVRNITKWKWRCMCSWTPPFSQLSVNSFWKSVEFRCFSHCCNSRHSVPFLCLRPLLLYIEPSSRWVLQAETAAFLLAIAPFPSPNGCFAHLSANYKPYYHARYFVLHFVGIIPFTLDICLLSAILLCLKSSPWPSEHCSENL